MGKGVSVPPNLQSTQPDTMHHPREINTPEQLIKNRRNTIEHFAQEELNEKKLTYPILQ